MKSRATPTPPSHIKLLMAIAFTILILASCSRRLIIYKEFEQANFAFDDVQGSVDFVGTWVEDEHVSVKGSPYYLSIALEEEVSSNSSPWAISGLEIYAPSDSDTTGPIIYKRPYPLESPDIVVRNGTKEYYFLIKKIAIPHEPVRVQFSLSRPGDADLRRVSVNLTPEAPKEEKSWPLLDRILSV